MIAAESLARCVGRQVHVFGVEYDEEGELRLLLTGRLVAVEEGSLAVGSDDVPAGEVDWLVDLRLVGAVALRVDKAADKPLRAVDGGRVQRLGRLPEPGPGSPAGDW